MAVKPIQPAETKPVLHPLPVIDTQMGFNGSKQHDPVKKAEKSMTAFRADIDNNGGSLYNFEDFAIVGTYKSKDEQEKDENEKSGLGAVNKNQAYILQRSAYYYEFEQDRYDFLEANYDDSWKYDKETYYFYGTNSDVYIDMVQNGDIIDEDGMCKMPPTKMGATVTEEEMDGLGRGDPEENADLTAENKVEDELEDEFESEQDASNDQEFSEAEPTAADPVTDPAINYKGSPLGMDFKNATSIPSEPAVAPAPEPAVAPVPAAANDRSFQLSA